MWILLQASSRSRSPVDMPMIHTLILGSMVAVLMSRRVISLTPGRSDIKW